MNFDGFDVPCANVVEILSVRNKDDSPLSENNWRRKHFGRITICWIAGGFRMRGAFFKGDIRRSADGNIESVNNDVSWCSSTVAQPIEVEPGIFDFETNTSIYRFRLIEDEEAFYLMKEVEAFVMQENNDCKAERLYS